MDAVGRAAVRVRVRAELKKQIELNERTDVAELELLGEKATRRR